jgi:hypothetical protein
MKVESLAARGAGCHPAAGWHFALRPDRPIDNRPQAASLPHYAGESKIVAAREETEM